ncbi:MAG: hypothetical protein LBS74_09540 [Oscillospiraceae bacterium]|jgi:hypothetical protein|nr:hypothetical protein [Oscillospiraceae bacterium]
MDSVRAYAAAVCIASAAAAIARGLVPTERFEKVMKLLLALFVLCAVIKPIKDLGRALPSLSLPDSSSYSQQAEYSEQTEAQLSNEIIKRLGQGLENQGTPASKITLRAKFADKGVIMLEGFSITIDTSLKNREAEIRKKAEEMVGFTPEILYED